MLTAADIELCRDECVAYLRSVGQLDWSSSIPELDMNVAQVVAHVAGATLWYAVDLAALGDDVVAITPQVDSNAEANDLIAALDTAASVLASVVRTALPESRGFHPFGQADASGFAAMVCDEMIVHTHDISRGLGEEFAPPADLVPKVLARLFPWIDGAEDPWTLLQFANGRLALPHRDRLSKWRWHCAPLEEWDGSVP